MRRGPEETQNRTRVGREKKKALARVKGKNESFTGSGSSGESDFQGCPSSVFKYNLSLPKKRPGKRFPGERNSSG
jgi:hypothetical protein